MVALAEDHLIADARNGSVGRRKDALSRSASVKAASPHQSSSSDDMNIFSSAGAPSGSVKSKSRTRRRGRGEQNSPVVSQARRGIPKAVFTAAAVFTALLFSLAAVRLKFCFEALLSHGASRPRISSGVASRKLVAQIVDVPFFLRGPPPVYSVVVDNAGSPAEGSTDAPPPYVDSAGQPPPYTSACPLPFDEPVAPERGDPLDLQAERRRLRNALIFFASVSVALCVGVALAAGGLAAAFVPGLRHLTTPLVTPSLVLFVASVVAVIWRVASWHTGASAEESTY